MLVDTHVHSRHSFDAKPNTASEIAAAAEQKGIGVLAITDHKDFRFHTKPYKLDIEASLNDVYAAREHSGIKILAGVELGQPHAPGAADFAAAYPFDYVIGSLHFDAFDRDYYELDYPQLDCDAIVHDYLREMLRMVQAGGFDTLAHLDYPLRVMHYEGYCPSLDPYLDEIVPILRAVIDRELALELNAATLFGWMKTPGPSEAILQEYRRLGGSRISIGSDAHSAADVGRGMQAYHDYAKRLGFTHVTIFEQRKPIEIAL